MLVHLAVRDFAIVERLELDLSAGMTVLTGETGAGKSILVDALNLAVGERASSDVVRAGRERAEVTAIFDTAGLHPVRQWLVEHELNEGDSECILRRTVATDGRSRAYVNGRPVPVQTLRALGEMLVDIHGQHAHQSLLRRPEQRRILDEHGDHAARLDKVSALYARYDDIQRERAERAGGIDDQGARRELLKYQIEELDALNLETDETTRLSDEQRRLSRAGELLDACQRAVEVVGGDTEPSVLSRLGATARELGDLQALDPALEEIGALLSNAVIHAQESAIQLRRYVDHLELDPRRLKWVEERLSAIHELARKHRVRPEELAGLHAALSRELADLENNEGRLQALDRALEETLTEYHKEARALSKARARAAKSLARQVSANMQDLGMPGGRFSIELEAHPEREPSLHGMDLVEFQVGVNVGHPLLPLARVASGGERSRIGLAIQVIGAQGAGVPTLIFDEVDVGVGGGVAEIVGQQLRRLAENRQVLCITHLPQVASQAHHHVRVQKRAENDAAQASLMSLSEADRVHEIARMLGGVKITRQTLAHAEEMLRRA